MINLIPPIAKKKIIREYWLRVLAVWMVILSIAGVAVVLLLSPTYILLNLKTTFLAEEAKVASEKLTDYDITAEELKLANHQAQILLSDQKEVAFSSYLKDIDNLAKPMVIINDWRFERKDGAGSITLTGVAATRQALANFRDQLATDTRFSSVDLPISNLIKGTDLLFSMTINLATSSLPTS